MRGEKMQQRKKQTNKYNRQSQKDSLSLRTSGKGGKWPKCRQKREQKNKTHEKEGGGF